MVIKLTFVTVEHGKRGGNASRVAVAFNEPRRGLNSLEIGIQNDALNLCSRLQAC